MRSLITLIVAFAAGAMFALPAGAAFVKWTNVNGTGNVVAPSTQQVTGPNCTGPANSAGAPSGPCEQFTVTVGTDVLKVRAYSTRNYQSVTTGTVDTTGSWITGDLANYSGGFAVSNRVSSDAASEASAPEHATDNENVMDVLVFELPTDRVWDLDQLSLGWAHEGNTYSGTASGRADIQTFFGGASMTANYDFSKVCFSACTNVGDKVLGAGGLGFTDVSSSLSQSGCTGQSGGNNVCSNVEINVTGTQSGRYLVMTAKHGALDTSGTSFGLDHFKVNMLKATGGPGAPIPGTLALLGLGFAGLVAVRRRSSRA